MDPAAALSWLEEAGLARHQPDVASGIAHSFETSPGFGAA
jgi:hypothetical protein